MNFFEHQEAARRLSRRLVVLFALAVVAIVIAVNVIATVAYLGLFPPPLPRGFYLTNTLVTLLMIGAGTWWETARLASGGEAVAQMIGARRVDPSTRDLLERRLINVVEEMALASGTPVPRLYVMENEQSINAFAAGHSLHDAVIAVTRGTLARLTRDELQGVIGHEFSHILNGDMRLNIRLIGVLFGLLMLSMFGRFMLEIGRGSRDSRGALAVLVVAGVALWILGYVGVFFGRLIKAAVSRQREYLADASSVQFTRNPDGIGGALRKIGGLTQGVAVHRIEARGRRGGDRIELPAVTPHATALRALVEHHAVAKCGLGADLAQIDATVRAARRRPVTGHAPWPARWRSAAAAGDACSAGRQPGLRGRRRGGAADR